MNINRIYEFFFPFFRTKRMQVFLKTFNPTKNTKILDVGGDIYNWTLINCPSEITLLNLYLPERITEAPKQYHFVVGDGTALNYVDGEFDICYSNSVIEHVGTYGNQNSFADEVRRVAQKIWIQTPARSFFLEPHLLTPFVHFLPKPVQRKLLRNLTLWGWLVRPSRDEIDKYLNEVRLLTYREMQQLFPDCEIVVERFLGMAKAYIAVRK